MKQTLPPPDRECPKASAIALKRWDPGDLEICQHFRFSEIQIFRITCPDDSSALGPVASRRGGRFQRHPGLPSGVDSIPHPVTPEAPCSP